MFLYISGGKPSPKPVCCLLYHYVIPAPVLEPSLINIHVAPSLVYLVFSFLTPSLSFYCSVTFHYCDSLSHSGSSRLSSLEIIYQTDGVDNRLTFSPSPRHSHKQSIDWLKALKKVFDAYTFTYMLAHAYTHTHTHGFVHNQFFSLISPVSQGLVLLHKTERRLLGSV